MAGTKNNHLKGNKMSHLIGSHEYSFDAYFPEGMDVPEGEDCDFDDSDFEDYDFDDDMTGEDYDWE